jgi:hypothetical protein
MVLPQWQRQVADYISEIYEILGVDTIDVLYGSYRSKFTVLTSRLAKSRECYNDYAPREVIKITSATFQSFYRRAPSSMVQTLAQMFGTRFLHLQDDKKASYWILSGQTTTDATIQQLGSSALTQDSVVAVGGNNIGSTAQTFGIGALTANALSFITNGIQRLFIATSTTNVCIGTANVTGSILTVSTSTASTSVFALSSGGSTANFFIGNGSPVGTVANATGSLAIDTSSGRL